MKKLYENIVNYVWYLKSKFWYKHHLLDIRNKHYGYKWGYIEPEEKLLLANFTILSNQVKLYLDCRIFSPKPLREHFFFEDAYLGELKQWGIEQELIALYNWWQKERPKNHAMSDQMINEIIPSKDPISQGLYSKYNGYMAQLNQKDEEMLIRLIKIRNSLWL